MRNTGNPISRPTVPKNSGLATNRADNSIQEFLLRQSCKQDARLPARYFPPRRGLLYDMIWRLKSNH